MKFLIKNSYLSKDPKTKKKGYYKDYFYVDRFFGYFLAALIFIWVGTLVYHLIKPEFGVSFSKIIQFHIVYIILAICFSLDTERINNFKVTKTRQKHI